MGTVTGLFPCLFVKPESILRLLVCPPGETTADRLVVPDTPDDFRVRPGSLVFGEPRRNNGHEIRAQVLFLDTSSHYFGSFRCVQWAAKVHHRRRGRTLYDKRNGQRAYGHRARFAG